MAVQVKVVGMDALLKKLDVDYLAEPVKRTILRESAEAGRDYLSQVVPRDTGASARTMRLEVRDNVRIVDAGARLGITANPLRYLEFGTKMGASKTLLRTRGRYVIRTSGGSQRIKKRRFMARTIGRTRSEIRKRTAAAVKEIEQRWSK